MLADVVISILLGIVGVFGLIGGLITIYNAFYPYISGDTRNPVFPPIGKIFTVGSIVTIVGVIINIGLYLYWT